MYIFFVFYLSSNLTYENCSSLTEYGIIGLFVPEDETMFYFSYFADDVSMGDLIADDEDDGKICLFLEWLLLL